MIVERQDKNDNEVYASTECHTLSGWYDESEVTFISRPKSKNGTKKPDLELIELKVDEARTGVAMKTKGEEEIKAEFVAIFNWKGKKYEFGYIFRYSKSGFEAIRGYTLTYNGHYSRFQKTRRDQMEEMLMETKEFESFKKEAVALNEKLKETYQPNIVVDKITELIEINGEHPSIVFTLKETGNIEFELDYRTKFCWTAIYQTYNNGIHLSPKGQFQYFKSYIGWTKDVIDQIFSHKSIRVRVLTGHIKRPYIGD